jgi:hypothetical protein
MSPLRSLVFSVALCCVELSSASAALSLASVDLSSASAALSSELRGLELELRDAPFRFRSPKLRFRRLALRLRGSALKLRGFLFSSSVDGRNRRPAEYAAISAAPRAAAASAATSAAAEAEVAAPCAASVRGDGLRRPRRVGHGAKSAPLASRTLALLHFTAGSSARLGGWGIGSQHN